MRLDREALVELASLGSGEGMKDRESAQNFLRGHSQTDIALERAAMVRLEPIRISPSWPSIVAIERQIWKTYMKPLNILCLS